MYIHKMKINFTYVFLAFILIFLIMVSMSKSCVSISPYTGSSMGYPYEGMTPMMMMSPAAMGNTLALPPSANGGNATIDPAAATNMLQNIMKQMSPSSNAAVSEGFTSNPSSNVTSYDYADNKLDVFSGTPGNLDCSPISSNLTNSKGPLCLNNNQINLLKTRGGNARGGDSQIGN